MIVVNYNFSVKFRDIFFLQKSNLVVSLPSTSSACFFTAFHQTCLNQWEKSIKLSLFSERLSWRRKLLSRHVILPSVTNDTCYLTTILLAWLIVGFLTPVANSAYIFRKRTCSTIYKKYMGPSYASYGCWIYNYLCNQCILPLTLWVRIPLWWGVIDATLWDKVSCGRLVGFSGYSDFLHQ